MVHEGGENKGPYGLLYYSGKVVKKAREAPRQGGASLGEGECLLIDRLEVLRELSVENRTKMVLLVMDGLGGLPGTGGQTELEAAFTPNLDALASRSETGLLEMVDTGITPGSGPGHLGLFGYDPLRFQIGRGIWKPWAREPMSKPGNSVPGGTCVPGVRRTLSSIGGPAGSTPVRAPVSSGNWPKG